MASNVSATDPSPGNTHVYPRPGFNTTVPQVNGNFGDMAPGTEKSMVEATPMPSSNNDPVPVAKISSFDRAKGECW